MNTESTEKIKEYRTNLVNGLNINNDDTETYIDDNDFT